MSEITGVERVSESPPPLGGRGGLADTRPGHPRAARYETIGDYYRANGESEHLHRLENALNDQWHSTSKLARHAGLSTNYAYKALPYLVEEGRAQRRKFHDATRYRRPQ
jgi:hypothetical protein